jgi:hypothetical protein
MYELEDMCDAAEGARAGAACGARLDMGKGGRDDDDDAVGEGNDVGGDDIVANVIPLAADDKVKMRPNRC